MPSAHGLDTVPMCFTAGFRGLAIAIMLSAAVFPTPVASQPAPPVNSPRQDPPVGAQSARPPTDYRVVAGSPLVSGGNSYTRAQVDNRLRAVGIVELRDVRKDDEGIWRGVGRFNGPDVEFGIDYRGSIAVR